MEEAIPGRGVEYRGYVRGLVGCRSSKELLAQSREDRERMAANARRDTQVGGLGHPGRNRAHKSRGTNVGSHFLPVR